MGKKPVVIFGTTFILKRNPWYSKELLPILVSIGKTPKKAEYILARPPPWFGKRYDKMTPKQIERLIEFSRVSSETAGKKLSERIPYIHKALWRGGRKPVSKAKPVGQRFHDIMTVSTAGAGTSPTTIKTT